MDVESAFSQYIVGGIKPSKYNINAIKEIDNCEYKSTHEVISPFGDVINISELSTGCKACILAANTDLEVDLLECGINARDFIIRNATNAKIAVDFKGILVTWGIDKQTKKAINNKINVVIDGITVTSVSELNRVICGFRPESTLSL